MLLFGAIFFLIAGVALTLLITFAEGMSDVPDSASWKQLGPGLAMLAVSAALFIVRHYLHGRPMTW